MVNFQDLINQAWQDHASQPLQVFETFPEIEKQIASNDEFPAYIRLVTHVCADHLGYWDQGAQILNQLKSHRLFLNGTESDFAIRRSVVTLAVCKGVSPDLKSFSLSDQIRILSSSAAPLFERGDSAKAKEYFNQALALTNESLSRQDPANRALAIAGNNLACSLEEKKDRTAVDIELMILAAKTARKFWEIAGGPSEVASAEYRLSQTYLQAGLIELSLTHAQISLDRCTTDLDFFFAHEAVALAAKKLELNDLYKQSVQKLELSFSKLSEDDKKWCQATLNKLK